MKSVTLLFPGQGSQYVGMGKYFIETLQIAQKFQQAGEILGIDLAQIILKGPEEKLKLTEFTQPAIFTYSAALYDACKVLLQKRNVTVSRVLGHSVGEFAALYAAGSLSFEDGLRAVHLRGKYMQEAVPEGEGKMYAMIKVPEETLLKACEAASSMDELVMPANFNEPNQTVISGHAKACQRAIEWLKENFPAKHMAIELKVSAPFHSSLMKSAQDKLALHLKNVRIEPNKIPYAANVNGKTYPEQTSAEVILDNLVQQVCGAVRWKQSLEDSTSDQLFLEIGPGKVLTGLNKKINPNFNTFYVDQERGLAQLEELL